VEIPEKEYRTEKTRTQRKVASLHVPEQTRLGNVASLVETLAASCDDATAEERRDMIRVIFDGVYSDPAAKRLLTLQPKPDFIVMFRQAGITQERQGLEWPSNLEDQEAATGTPDWERRRCQWRAIVIY